MTIKLLHAFNGLSPGVYSNVNPAEETRLIALALAVRYTPGMYGENPVLQNEQQRSLAAAVQEYEAGTLGTGSGTAPQRVFLLGDSITARQYRYRQASSRFILSPTITEQNL